MLSNPAAKIIVTRDRDDLTQYLASRGTSPLKNSYSFNNSNFLELIHSFADGGRSVISLKFIDPEGIFEDYLIPAVTDSDVPGDALKALSKRLEAHEIVPGEGKGEIVSDQILEDIRSMLGILSKRDSTFHITYGVGEDFDTWAGPYRCKVLSIAMDYGGDGTRSFVVELVPTDSIYFHLVNDDTPELNLDAFSQYNIEGRTPKFKETINEEIRLPYKKEQEIIYKEKNVSVGRKASEEYLRVDHDDPLLFDYHWAIQTIIQDYCKKALGGSPVLVLLPNLNATLFTLARATKIALSENFYKNPGNLVRIDIARRGKVSTWGVDGAVEFVLNHFNIQMAKSFATVATGLEKAAWAMITGGRGGDTRMAKENQESRHKIQVSAVDYAYYKYDVRGSEDGSVPAFRPDIIANDLNAGFHNLGFPLINVIVKEENNARILQLWKEEGIIDKEVDSITILGDMSLLTNYLYGGVYTQALASGKDEEGTTTELQDALGSVTKGSEVQQQQKFSLATPKSPNPDLPHWYDPTRLPYNEVSLVQNSGGLEINLEKIFDIGYAKKISEIILPSKAFGIYGQQATIHNQDEYSIEAKAFERARKGRFPIFRSGIKNPNVLSLSVDVNRAYFAFAHYSTGTQLGLNTLYKVLSSHSPFDPTIIFKLFRDKSPLPPGLAGLSLNEDIERHAQEWWNDSSDIVNFIGKIEQGLKAAGSGGIGLGIGHISPASRKDIARVIAYLWVLSRIKAGEIPVGIVSKLRPHTGTKMEIFDKLRRMSFKTTINTLPMFHLSDMYHTLDLPCFLIAKQPIIQGQEVTEKLKRISTLFTGQYTIVGFTHTINSREAYSSFNLLQTNKSGSVTVDHLLTRQLSLTAEMLEEKELSRVGKRITEESGYWEFWHKRRGSPEKLDWKALGEAIDKQ